MLLGARQFFERRGAPTPPLPYDAEVEYLESTGTQWISTGLVFQKDIRIVLSVTYLDRNSWGRNAGSYEVFWGSGGSFWFGGGQQVITRQNNVMYNLDLDFTAGAMVGKIDGNVARTTTGTQPTATYIGLFGRWSFSSAEPSTAKMRHGGITIYQGGNTLLDWQAVRFTNEQGVSEGAMYDRVSGALFRNAGTGAFTIGPDKVEWTNPYVTDGLIAMWDGEWNAGGGVHDPNATVWKDLSGNNMDFSLVEGNSSWLGDALLGASRSAGYIGSLSASSIGTVGFVEFVGNPYYGVGDGMETTPGMILDGATSGSVINLRIRGWASRKVCSILKGSKNCPWYVTPGMGTKSEDRTVYCAGEVSGADVGTVYYNGDEVTPQTFGENFDASPYVCLGAYKTNDARYPYEGSINCIRIYNRALTTAEIAANYSIDKARFNLP